MAWAKAYLRTKWHHDPSSRLATIVMGQKLGALPPILGRGAGSPSKTISLGPRPTSLLSSILIYATIWPQQIWGENCGGGAMRLCHFGGGGAGSPSNTVWPGPRPTCTPSFILIHQTVWSQYTNVTDRTNRHGPHSIRQNILQTVAQKWLN